MLKRTIKKYWNDIFGIRFWVGILLVFLFFQLDANMPIFFDEYRWEVLKKTSDFKTVLTSCVYFGMYIGMVTIAASISFGIQFSEEWKAGVAPHLIRNMGMTRYTLSYSIFATVSGGGIAMMGFLLYAIYMKSHIDFLNQNAANPTMQEMMYAFTLKDKSGVQFVVVMALIMFVFGAVSAVVALCVSTFTDNKYLVVFAPYLVYRGYVELSKIIALPKEWRLDYYLTGRVNIGNNFTEFVLIIIGSLFAIILVGQKLFKKGVRRRLIYGKY